MRADGEGDAAGAEGSKAYGVAEAGVSVMVAASAPTVGDGLLEQKTQHDGGTIVPILALSMVPQAVL